MGKIILFKYAKKRGWKVDEHSNYCLLTKGGKIVFIVFNFAGGALDPEKYKLVRELLKAGCDAFVIDNVSGGLRIIDEIK